MTKGQITIEYAPSKAWKPLRYHPQNFGSTLRLLHLSGRRSVLNIVPQNPYFQPTTLKSVKTLSVLMNNAVLARNSGNYFVRRYPIDLLVKKTVAERRLVLSTGVVEMSPHSESHKWPLHQD